MLFYGYIRVFPFRFITLVKPLSFRTPSGFKGLLKNGAHKNELRVEMIIKGKSPREAIQVASFEIDKIANRLSWAHGMPIKGAKITGSQKVDIADGRMEVSLNQTITIGDSLTTNFYIKGKAASKLALNLSNKCTADFEEILIMWKDALGQETDALKFLLLFRLLEWIHRGEGIGKERKAVDRWIRLTDPKLPLEKDKNGKSDISVLTFLRDNIHAKSIDFPFSQISSHLPRLQALVKLCIKEKYGE